MSTNTIELEHVGPVARLSIPVPAGGGLVVLRGRNGQGKSICLEAAQSLFTGKGRVPVRDGAERAVVDGCGARLTVGRSTRRAGELEVQSLEGRLNVAELVDPGLKDPAAADARRIKALVGLIGAEARVELFHGLLGGPAEFHEVVPHLEPTDDLVVMAERVKRKCEEAARGQEHQADHAEGQAQADANAANGIDLAAPSEAGPLAEALEAAVVRRAQLREQAAAASEAQRKAEVARGRMEAAQAASGGPSTAEAQHEAERLDAKKLAAQKAVLDLEGDLRSVNQALENAQTQATHAARLAFGAEALLKSCRDRDGAVAEAGRTVTEMAQVAAPDPAELAAADEAVQTSQRAAERGETIRRATLRMAMADDHRKRAGKLRGRAEALRDAAHGTDQVLSDVVGRTGTRLRVQAGRLILEGRRGATPFGELSAGERWREALDIALASLPAGTGVLTIPQEAWEGLDPINREAIAEHVAERGVLVLTAEADEGVLRAEVA